MLFGLLSFAGPAAAGAVFTMGVVCLYTGFSIPIAARHLGGRKFVPGPFTLGKLVRKLELNSLLILCISIQSAPIAFIAVSFMSFMIIILMFPSNTSPGADTMNYTIVVVGGILGSSIVYYFFPKYGGRHWFTGPVRTIEKDLSHSPMGVVNVAHANALEKLAIG